LSAWQKNRITHKQGFVMCKSCKSFRLMCNNYQDSTYHLCNVKIYSHKKPIKMKRNPLIIVFAVILFALPKLSFGQINLGAAADFVIYTSGGSVHDNASAHSHLTGDVGYFTSGDFLGFGNVNGVMHPGVDPATTACNLALLSALAQINATSNDYAPGLLLGNGVVFTPGVYSIPGNATLNLDLILDAQNNPNAEFIIKINGTFATNAGSSVKLINGAQACHVFWKTEGAVSMATNTSMKGSIIANNAAITMATGDSLEGRLLCVTAGAITIDGITAFTPQGCGSPILTGPPLPTMGSIACFTIFSSNGALTNSIGTSSVTGDVGNNGIGSITGWTPADVTGTLHLTQDTSTIQAAIDLSNLYNELNAMVPDIELLYPAEFGNNLTLTPHIYVMNSAAIFTDSLYLDAQGNPDGVFVIKIVAGSPALTTSTYSKVKLINGAQAKNVFWLINGAVGINNYSVFKGTIVVPNGAINLVNTGVVLDGRALTMVGAITTAGLVAVMPPGCGVLPCDSVEITSEPVSQMACAGDSVSFSVNATGTDLVYQWRKGMTPLINGGNISGADSATLIINPAGFADTASDYNVLISGLCGPNDSSVFVSLVINSATAIMTQPVDQTVCSGDSASFVVVASGSGLSYQWRKGMTPLINGGNISGADSATLIIYPAGISDTASDYNVLISGLCGPNDSSVFVSLFVNSAPVIMTQPVDQTICSGDSASFVVVASGSGLSYQWRKGMTPLINGGNISGADSATLIIYPAGISDTASDYNVLISGLCGPNDSSVFVSLFVNSAPVIITQPVDQSVCSGDSASFVVVASGSGLNYQWRKGTTNLINGGNISGVNTSTLTIYPANISDTASDYNVLINGLCGPGDSSVYVSLFINSAPVIITQPANQTICVGDSVSFVVVAAGSGLSYQWRKGTVNLINGGNISGVTNDTLTINPATISDIASNYNVVVTGICIATDTTGFGLDSAGMFGILAGTAITSTGFSVINDMDVGLSPGVRSSITGFPPAIVVNGAIYASDDIAPPGVAAMLIQAKQDLTDAYLLAEGATAPAPATIAGDQGGKVLTPGIYKSTSSLLIQSGDLTLDAQGDVNASWIFQIASDFTTIGGAGGSVILTGGAQANHVTWQVGSSATIGNGTSFAGNILALTSITMNTGSSIDGRLLAINGAVVLSGTNIINGPSDSTTSIVSQSISVNVSLDVSTAPVIITQPLDQTICAGDSASFTVVASGGGLSYQWRKGLIPLVNGGNISGADSATLIINPAGIADTASDYNVLISGLCSPNDSSIYVSLFVNTAPVIITQPVDQIICAGDSVSFVVIASGSGLSYQWRKGLIPLVNGGNISGADSATLIINPAGIADTASDYNVLISGLCSPNDSSVYVSLFVNTAPVIISQPVDQVICIGDSVSFVVVAGGSGLSYQWRKGLTPLVNGGNISGANSATLTINPAGMSDAAPDYNVLISGLCGPDYSSVYVSLFVNIAPGIIAQPLDQTICAGDSASFTVVASGSGLSYQWRKGLLPLINGGNISGADSATLIINPAGIADAASDYNVLISGLCSPNDSSVYVSLFVNTAPVIITQPVDQTICAGDSVSFVVIASGSGLSYQWRKGLIPLVNGGNISGADSATLIINPAGIADTASDYNVLISGLCGPAAFSVNISLIINPAPFVNSSATDTICSDVAQNYLITSDVPGTSYNWSRASVSGISNPAVTGQTSNPITETLTNTTAAPVNVIYLITPSANGCPGNTFVYTVTADPIPVAIANSNTDICIGGTINLNAQTVAGGTYLWTGPNGYSSADQNPIIFSVTELNEGIYTLVVTTNGCNSLPSTVTITVIDCSIDLSLVKTVDNSYPLIGNDVTFTITATNNGPYNATGVIVTEVLQSGYVFVSASATSGIYDPLTGLWTIGTLNTGASATLTLTATVVAEGNYVNTVTISGNETDINSANDIAVIQTYPLDLFIPEGFSPNGDGINDLFVIRGINNYPDNTFLIFNRWGDKVSEASPYINNWDGRSSRGVRVGENELPVGTYFYILDLGNGSEVLTGTIYLNR
jgi:gliding motility-associated-like protein/uncharacterized repeat protein (TIGR01451 family)